MPQVFYKIKTEGTLPKLFCSAIVILLPKPHKYPAKQENYRPISFVNIDAKILEKILGNRIQGHIEVIHHHDHMIK